MTEELVQFAAKKLNVKNVECINEEYYSVARGFVKVDDESHFVESKDIFDLTSFDLFGRGLAVCPHSIALVNTFSNKWKIQIIGVEAMQEIRGDITEMPQAFWTCWYRLEHRPTEG